MISTIKDFHKVETFAKQYRGAKGLGVSRQYIYNLIRKEEAEPNSTDIDVLTIDGLYFCKYRITKPKK